MKLSDFNSLPKADAIQELIRCCGSQRWADAMADARPLADLAQLLERADRVWEGLTREDWLEAFRHHPRIGEQSLRAKFASTATWASQEQKGVQGASEAVLQGLLKGNEDYEKRFGHVFLICATGKSAQEMLASLQSRIAHDPETELRTAAGEQAKITRIRLERLLSE
jgi:2-oxo-4-hydroxy-4-carboxy-5-ureidoimidazoline decarboxylase